MAQPESVALFYTEGSSDKVYQVQLVADGDGWCVNAQNGRRGGTLKGQTKTPTPIAYAPAKAIYDKLVQSKKKDGYTEDASGSAYQDTVTGQDFTGIVPQLLNPLDDETEVQDLLDDPAWVAQEKHDGERRLTRKADGRLTGINRDGLAVPLALAAADALGSLTDAQFVVDGEIMGERFVLFDLLEWNGQDLRPLSYEERLARLQALLPEPVGPVEVCETARGRAAKQALADRVRAEGGEGVVFKRADAPWAAGRPASRGSQRKWKYVQSATLVAGHPTPGKRSVAVFAAGPTGERVAVGKVTVPPNHPVPAPDTVVEVGYLYRMPGQGGCLFQPTYKGARADKHGPDELGSLKVKAAIVAPQVRKPRPGR